MQIVGASGAVMGFVGLTIADIAINSGELTQVMLRLAIIAAVVIFFVVTAVTEVKTVCHAIALTLHQPEIIIFIFLEVPATKFQGQMESRCPNLGCFKPKPPQDLP